MNWRGAWKDYSAVCLASGPSLTDSDIEAVRQWRQAAPERVVIVTNTTYQKAPWADAIFGHDYKWWKTYLEDINRNFNPKGLRFCCMAAPAEWRVIHLQSPDFKSHGNSGSGAIMLAIGGGCSAVVLAGYDGQRGPRGEVHHHGDHPNHLGNAFSMPRWPKAFNKVANDAKSNHVRVINASRNTVYNCFERLGLATALEEV